MGQTATANHRLDIRDLKCNCLLLQITCLPAARLLELMQMALPPLSVFVTLPAFGVASQVSLYYAFSKYLQFMAFSVTQT